MFENLSNQRLSFFAGLMAAKALNSSFILNKWNDGNVKTRVRRRPFQYFWSFEHLLEIAKQEGIEILQGLPNAHKSECLAQLLSSESLQLKIENMKSGRVAILCATPQETFHDLWREGHLGRSEFLFHGLSEHKTFDSSPEFMHYRTFLRPASKFVSASDRIIQRLRRELGIEEFFAIHVRLEKDFTDACRVWDRIDNLKCHITEDEMVNELLNKHSVSIGAPVYVASGLPSESLPTLCSTFRCFQKTDVWTSDALAPFGNSLALIDLTICSHASQAFGNIYSTFSVELAAAIRSVGRHAAYYNMPCPSPEDCF